jgi:hypothetical protein
MTDIIVKIMVELLSVLALATKQIKRGRFSTCSIKSQFRWSQLVAGAFAKKLLGDSEIGAVLRRLDRLTQDEARTTGAQTLSVVHGLVSNMKEVMEGTQSFLIFRRCVAERRFFKTARHQRRTSERLWVCRCFNVIFLLLTCAGSCPSPA